MGKVIWLLDYDGCSDAIFNEMTPGVTRPTYEAKKPHQFSSDPLAGEIQKDIEKGNTVSIGIGSNRYSTELDQRLAKEKGNGPCHANLKALAKQLDCEFNALMLADPYNQKKAGYAFDNSTEELKSPPIIEDIEDKVSSLYMQLHHAASKRQDDETITINFVDDREDILDRLKAFFTEHPDFIPKGIQLNLLQYAPYAGVKAVKPYHSFDTGTGPEDRNYLNTTRYLLRCVDDPIAELRRTTMFERLNRVPDEREAQPHHDIRPHIVTLMRGQKNNPLNKMEPSAIADAITEAIAIRETTRKAVRKKLGGNQAANQDESELIQAIALLKLKLTNKTDKLLNNLIVKARAKQKTDIATTLEDSYKKALTNLWEKASTAKLTGKKEQFETAQKDFKEEVCQAIRTFQSDVKTHKSVYGQTRLLALAQFAINVLYTIPLVGWAAWRVTRSYNKSQGVVSSSHYCGGLFSPGNWKRMGATNSAIAAMDAKDKVKAILTDGEEEPNSRTSHRSMAHIRG